MIKLNPEYLRTRFEYDPNSGELVWKKANARWLGKPAGSVNVGTKGSQHIRVMLDGKGVYAHRIIWAIVHGCSPEHIDHIDGNGLNNRIENLRSVSHAENLKNQKMHKTNTTGVAGVSYRKDSGKWRARIMNNGSSINLGTFATLEQAAAARQQYASANGYHENHGRMTA